MPTPYQRHSEADPYSRVPGQSVTDVPGSYQGADLTRFAVGFVDNESRMASTDFEKEKNAFKEYYRINYDALLRADTAFRVLIRSLLAAVSDIHRPQITSRVKDCEECIGKFSRRYQRDLEEHERQYEIKDYITDLIGVRITCFYESEVDMIVGHLKQNFKIAGMTDKRAAMEAVRDTFGYKGVHLDVQLNDKRRSLPEYYGINQFRFEVQVRTIIQHAWSEIDHAISYKRSIPAELDRRIRALAALFEVADKEFLAIRDQSQQLKQKAETRAPEEPEEAGSPMSLDVFAAQAILGDVFPNYHFIPSYVDGFVNEIVEMKSDVTDRDFASAHRKHIGTVERYAEYVEGAVHRKFNPFTRMRHALYLFDRTAFKGVLFEIQRQSFEKWLAVRRSRK